jgi:hypothetical protein
MLKKFTALLMLTSFTHAFAMTPVQETSAMAKALEKTFTEMNYSLNVEWDQKDQVYFNNTVDGFEQQVKDLQDQGLTNKELIEFTLAKVKDKQTQKDIAEISKVISESNMTPDQARDFALEKLSSTQSQGASWSGSRMGIKLVVILALIIIIVCATNSNHDDDNDDHDRPHKPECRDDYYNESDYRGGGYNQCNQYPTAA